MENAEDKTTVTMTSDNANEDKEIASKDETQDPIPVRWATVKRTLGRQTTRLTIIDEPTDVVTLDDDESAKSTTSETKSLGDKGCASFWMDLAPVQRRFLLQGVMVRVILMIHTFFIFYAAMVHLHVAVYVCVCFLYATVSVIEAMFMYKMRGFSQKKWICTSTLLYTISVIPAIWSLHFSMLRKRESDSFEACLQNYSSCHTHPVYNQVMYNISSRTFVAQTYSEYVRLTKVIEYTVVFVLIFCRWLLPRDNFTREKVAQLLLVLIGSGEDIVEFIEVLFTSGHFGCSRAITVVVLLLWSIAVFQFSIAIPEKTPRVSAAKPDNAILDVWVGAVNALLAKRRETAGDISLYVAKQRRRPLSSMMQRRKTLPNIGSKEWVRSTEFREAIISITVQDGPFLIFRLTVLVILGDAAFSVFFYALKNLTVILLQIYRVYAMLVEFRQRRRNSLFPVGTGSLNDVEISNYNLDEDDSESMDGAVDDLTVDEKVFVYSVDENRRDSKHSKISTKQHERNGSVDKSPNRTPVVLPKSSETDLRTRRQSKILENYQE